MFAALVALAVSAALTVANDDKIPTRLKRYEEEEEEYTETTTTVFPPNVKR